MRANVDEASYEREWRRLNRRLVRLERSEGLGAALAALREHQVATGFIRDDTAEIERYRLPHPEDDSRFFSVQFNPRRAERLRRPRPRVAPQSESVHEGCVLCRDNVRQQQVGRELGYELQLGSRPRIVWMNPYPLLPLHAVVAARDHVPQPQLTGRRAAASIALLVSDLVTLAARLPGYVGFFNGVGAGASIPAHYHLQFFDRRLEASPFPLEIAADLAHEREGSVPCYPMAVRFWRGEAERLASSASDWISRWCEERSRRNGSLTANLIAARQLSSRETRLFFVPRRGSNGIAPSHPGSSLGGLEVLGELVLSDRSQKRSLELGEITYGHVEQLLLRASLPLD